MVSVHVACTDMDDKEAETQRNRLMTSLAAGDGEDVIVLSGLDDNALAKKGVLMDLSDIVTPMEENGEFAKVNIYMHIKSLHHHVSIVKSAKKSVKVGYQILLIMQ